VAHTDATAALHAGRHALLEELRELAVP